MHVNYYVKYSSINPAEIAGDENLIKFFSSIANYFDIPNAIIYASYLNCNRENEKILQIGGLNQRGFTGTSKKRNNKIG